MKRNRSPLEGIKVFEITLAGVGPYVSKHLGDNGAEVIRAESHTAIDPLRTDPPFKDNIPGPERSGWYSTANTGKFSISLNLNKPEGVKIGARLIQWADVVVTNLSGNVLEKWELDYKTVVKSKEKIIYFHSTMFGSYGPYSSMRAYGFVGSILSGLFHLCGQPGSIPGFTMWSYPDFVMPRLGVAAIIAALDRRRKTGKGIYIDQSQLEGTVCLLGPAILEYSVNGRIMQAQGNRVQYASPHGTYPCIGRNRWVAIAVFNDMEWKALCKVMKKPAMIEDKRFSTLLDRKKNEEELDKIVSEWTQRHTPQKVESLLQEAGVSAGIVANTADLFSDPQLKHRKHFRWLEHPVIGKHAHEAPCYLLSKTPIDLVRPGPCLGQHNKYVLKDIMGMSDTEIMELERKKVITTEADLPKYATTF